MPRLLSPRARASSRLSLEATVLPGRRARASPRARVAVARASSLTIARPDDWHLHVRDASKLADVVPFTSKTFKRALVMPNLTPPVRTASEAEKYRELIAKAAPASDGFEPHMTLYLTDNTTVEQVEEAHACGFVRGYKLYPAGATTNSEFGVTDVANVAKATKRMAELGLTLQVHGEVTHASVDVFDREARFIQDVLMPLLDRSPDLRVVMEHITTRDAAEFVAAAGPNVAASVTPQHVLFNRNALFKGGLRPHFYCLPILKREEHREAVLAAATSGSGKFFLGTDSAPHPKGAKEAACGCAGIFSAHAALPLYAMAFESVDALDKLEAFASHNGADFYRVPRNTETVTLEKKAWKVPDEYKFGDTTVVPFYAGEEIPWSVV
jgi:dihydroorotase